VRRNIFFSPCQSSDLSSSSSFPSSRVCARRAAGVSDKVSERTFLFLSASSSFSFSPPLHLGAVFSMTANSRFRCLSCLLAWFSGPYFSLPHPRPPHILFPESSPSYVLSPLALPYPTAAALFVYEHVMHLSGAEAVRSSPPRYPVLVLIPFTLYVTLALFLSLFLTFRTLHQSLWQTR
jgi:hypothetical protein